MFFCAVMESNYVHVLKYCTYSFVALYLYLSISIFGQYCTFTPLHLLQSVKKTNTDSEYQNIFALIGQDDKYTVYAACNAVYSILHKWKHITSYSVEKVVHPSRSCMLPEPRSVQLIL